MSLPSLLGIKLWHLENVCRFGCLLSKLTLLLLPTFHSLYVGCRQTELRIAPEMTA